MLHPLIESSSDKSLSEMGDAQDAESLLQLTAYTSTSTVLLDFLLSAAWATASDWETEK